MKLEVKNDISDTKYIDAFLHEASEIPVKIMELIDKKNVIIRLVNNVKDIKPIETLKHSPLVQYESEPIRGVMNDEELIIAICRNNTPINAIGAVLYHELGHFIDAYKNFGNIKSLYDLTYSSEPEFINGYREDLAENWNQIQKDSNPKLQQFIQGSTPERIVQTAMPETFAEIFRYLNNKQNDTKTVELYFHNSIQICRKNLSYLHLPLQLA